MTVTTTDAQVQYAGDGSTTQFPFSFVTLEEDDMDVLLTNTTGSTLDGIAPFSTTQLTLNDDYSITISNPGGTVDLSGGSSPFGAPSSGVRITLLRDTDFTQEIDYLENDPFPADTHETGLDRSALRDQEIQEALDRLVRTQVGDQTTNLELPLTIERQGKVLAFDSNGNAIATDAGELDVQVGTGTLEEGELLVYDLANNQFQDKKKLAGDGGTIPETDNTNTYTVDQTFQGGLIHDSTGATQVAAGTTAERPGSPVDGQVRYNTDNDQYEAYDSASGSWGPLGGAGLYKGENGERGDTASGAGDIFRVHEQELNTDVTIEAGENAVVAGPLKVASGTTLTVNGNLSVV